ncbi:reverse transcriptase domain-containing protein [Tanacetum coccineum]
MVVKKDNEKWKLCVDFTNINKACIREPHPLPAAEQKAEGLHKYRLKCFLDAYKGYHQIPIAEKEEEKTAFFTKEGMGRNMEVNADDMVIKSDSEEEMMADIAETLERLRAINLKLNPKKCSFGVEEGIYSGHLITKQGIRADPSKVPLKEREKDTPFHENSEKLYEWKDGSMDEGGRRSLPENERMLRVIASDGRIAKWAIELGEHEIEFRGMNSIKGHILANFLAETPLTENKEAKNEEVKRKEPKPENAWKLFTDGASSFDGSGAGLMVVSQEGKEYTYALRFKFETTNNEAEYEALLIGLRIAKEMEI